MSVTREAPSVAADATAALPVLVRVDGAVRDGVRSWVEGVLGWQPVDPDADLLVPARLCLSSPDVALSQPATREVPTVLLVGEDDHPARVAEAAVRVQPVATLRWPQDRDQLVEAAQGGLLVPRPAAAGPRMLRVGGAAGGVGTSTVAAALAGLFAWQGEATLLVLAAGTPLADVCDLRAEALAGTGLWSQAAPVAGVARARAVRVRGATADLPTVADPSIGVCVVDTGVGDDADVLVCRADAAGMAAAGRTTAAAVVVIGSGPAPRAAVQQACGRRRRVHLPRSARVARAGLQGRVPSGLPGSWLRPLIPLTRGSGGQPP